MCQVLNVSSSYFYRWLVSPEPPGEQRSKTHIDKIEKIHGDSGYIYGSPENLLGRDFSADTLSQKWVGDITYIHTSKGWLYLTTVIDLADRKVVGWSLSTDMTVENTSVSAMKMAIKNRGVRKGLIFHSDRGI